MLDKIAKFREYLDYIEEHYNNVQRAWKIIQQKCPGLYFMTDPKIKENIDKKIIEHDESKLSAQEFCSYRRNFFPVEGEDREKEAFSLAWMHHKQNNDHHHQNWVGKWHEDEVTGKEASACCVAMVADFMAMSMRFKDNPCDYFDQKVLSDGFPDCYADLVHKIFDLVIFNVHEGHVRGY